MMRPGKKMSLEEIRAYTEELVRKVKFEEKKTQKEIAEDLGMPEGNLSNAINKANSRWLGTQSRIIEHYSKYTITRRVEYVVELKSENKED